MRRCSYFNNIVGMAHQSYDDLMIHDDMSSKLLGHKEEKEVLVGYWPCVEVDLSKNRDKFEINCPPPDYEDMGDEVRLPSSVASFLVTYRITAPDFCLPVDALRVWLEKEVSLFEETRRIHAIKELAELVKREAAFFESGRTLHLFPWESWDESCEDDLPDLVPCTL
jgi:hypothetical protein